MLTDRPIQSDIPSMLTNHVPRMAIRSIMFCAISCVASIALLSADDASQENDRLQLSLRLQQLEADLTDPDYAAIVETMIVTDLAAEWERVATPDNYHLFAQERGGMDKINADPALKAAWDRRHRIAQEFLSMMRDAYAAMNRDAPFDDTELLQRTLESAGKKSMVLGDLDIRITPILPADGAEDHWPSFRGPTGQSLVFDERMPREWSAEDGILWQTPLPGRGNSSPVIWGQKIFITAEGGDETTSEDNPAGPARLLLCYDRATGDLLWEHAAPPAKELETLYWKNSFASSTVVTDGERVIAFLGNGGLLCCDLEGERLWHQDLGTFPTMHGPGSTPVLYENLVILVQDQTKGESLFAAYDKETGEQRWRHERPGDPCWSTPVLLRIGDRDELLFNGSHVVVSYDPATGEELWRVDGSSRESIPMIVSGGGLLYSVSGRNGPIIAIRPGGNGDVTDSHIVWQVPRGGPHVPTPAYHDGRLYIISDTGVMDCRDAITGETLWQERLPGRFSMSPLIVGDELLLFSESGTSYLLKSSPQFELLAENELDETVLATPAILDGRIYVRTDEHLLCIGNPVGGK